MEDLISVVIPIYNVEKCLEKCVNSVIKQTYKNIEIFLIDDGSKDKSGKMCDDLAKKDDRIRVFHKKNGGLSDARNYGTERANGKYIVFIDSDDFVDSKYLEYLYNLITTNNADISVCNYFFYYGDTKKNEKRIMFSDSEIVLEKNDAIEKLLEDTLINSFAWNKMYKKSLFDKIKYPKDRIMEDVGTTYKLFFYANRIVVGDSPMYYYYQREESILHKKNAKFYKDYFDLTNKRYKDIMKWYPDMNINYSKMMYYLLAFYCVKDNEFEEYLREQNIRDKIKSLKILMDERKMKLGYKLAIKYYLFKITPHVYKRIVGAYKCLKKQDYI